MKDRRKQQLTDWLEGTRVAPNGALQVVSGDASFRRYFRYPHQQHWLIAVDAPPPQESLQPFMAIAQRYREEGIHAPEVHAYNEELGFMVLEDFGDQLLFSQLIDEQAALDIYQHALAQLPAVMRVTSTGVGSLPLYDRALLERELGLFSEWLMNQHLAMELSDNQRHAWHQGCELLIETALQQPQVGVHRDYHSRNIMLIEDTSELGIIDFQDAVIGPITYDAVSLLRDCYVKWPNSLVSSGLAFLHQRLQTEQLLAASVSLPDFEYWFDLMGLQRHLKAAGIFARLLHRDGKPGYMADVPRTLSYIVDISGKYPALTDFRDLILLVQQRLPQVASQ